MGPAPLRVRPVQAVLGEHQLHPPVVGGAGDLGQQQRRPAQGGGTAGVIRQPAFIKAAPLAQTAIVNQARYRARSLPAAGALLKPEDRGETQISLL